MCVLGVVSGLLLIGHRGTMGERIGLEFEIFAHHTVWVKGESISISHWMWREVGVLDSGLEYQRPRLLKLLHIILLTFLVRQNILWVPLLPYYPFFDLPRALTSCAMIATYLKPRDYYWRRLSHDLAVWLWLGGDWHGNLERTVDLHSSAFITLT